MVYIYPPSEAKFTTPRPPFFVDWLLAAIIVTFVVILAFRIGSL